MEREQYIRKLKTDLDRWDEQICAWEARLGELSGESHARLRTHIEAWRTYREIVERRLCRAQSATAAAWQHMARDTDRAWLGLARAYDRASRALAPEGASRRTRRAPSTHS